MLFFFGVDLIQSEAILVQFSKFGVIFLGVGGKLWVVDVLVMIWLNTLVLGINSLELVMDMDLLVDVILAW